MPDVAMQRKKTGWANVALGDVAMNSTVATQTPEQDGFTRYIIGKHIPDDGDKITTWGEVGDGEFGSRIRTVVKPGDIVCTTRGPQLRVAVATFDCLSAHTNFVLRTNNAGVILQDYLQALACSDRFQEHLRRNFRGSTNLFVNWSDAAKFEFALPPIDEQRRLTSALNSAGHLVEALLGTVDRMRSTQAAFFNDFVLKAGATPCELGNLLLESPRNGCSATPAEVPTGHWVLALSAISRWGYRHDELKPVSRTRAMELAVIARGDLVLSRSNTRELVGLPAVFPEDRTDVSYPDTMMRLTVDPSRVDARYLELCLRAPGCRHQVQSFAAGTSASMKKINGSNLRKVTVPLIPRAKQEVVLNEVDRISRLIGETERRLEEVRNFRTTLIDAAFGPTP
ncbi:MAG: hypothetical protein ABL986_04685 [Vicinamibacterales bacterium]